jgi:Family of unknown function (DUF6364)
MSKLTLSVDERVVSRAKRHAKRHGVSVSKMVENYLASVAEPNTALKETPILRSLRGVLKHTGLRDYKKHLTAKYR